MAKKRYAGAQASNKPAASGRRSSSQVRRILNVLPSLHTEQDWMFQHAVDSDTVGAPAALPTTKDLRESWWSVGDQGSTGSCVGWGTADAVLRWHFVKAGRLPKTNPLAVRFIWMAAKETDEYNTQPTTFIDEDGTSLKAALDIARKYGVVPDSVLPFKTGQLYGQDVKTFYALAAKLKIASYFNLQRNLANWRTWLATQGPILTRLDVDATWDNALTTAGKLDVYQTDTARGGHCVAIVGYTPDRFIIRNSWGTTQWGDKGFAYASFGYAQAAFTEAYGVSL